MLSDSSKGFKGGTDDFPFEFLLNLELFVMLCFKYH